MKQSSAPLRVFVLAVAATVATACGRSPVVRYHALPPLGAEAPRAACTGLAVAVGPAEIARYLDRPGIVRRSGETGIEYDRLHRWAENLESEILRVIGRNLSTLLDSRRIVVYPADSPFPLAWRVSLDVEQLDAETGGDLVLRVRWIIHRLPRGEAEAVELTDLHRQNAPAEAVELVKAYGDVLGELSREVAAKICALTDRARAPEEPDETAAPGGRT